MGRPATENDQQIAIRLPAEWLARADKLIPALTTPGLAVSRSDVLRAALARGLDALEREQTRKTSRTRRQG
jgi:Arc/MetJ-type ribon-helix-helix transcriptional regulator